jgi:hypothetical protein
VPLTGAQTAPGPQIVARFHSNSSNSHKLLRKPKRELLFRQAPIAIQPRLQLTNSHKQLRKPKKESHFRQALTVIQPRLRPVSNPKPLQKQKNESLFRHPPIVLVAFRPRLRLTRNLKPLRKPKQGSLYRHRHRVIRPRSRPKTTSSPKPQRKPNDRLCLQILARIIAAHPPRKPAKSHRGRLC